MLEKHLEQGGDTTLPGAMPRFAAATSAKCLSLKGNFGGVAARLFGGMAGRWLPKFPVKMLFVWGRPPV